VLTTGGGLVSCATQGASAPVSNPPFWIVPSRPQGVPVGVAVPVAVPVRVAVGGVPVVVGVGVPWMRASYAWLKLAPSGKPLA
jgi:hypothetical protein